MFTRKRKVVNENTKGFEEEQEEEPYVPDSPDNVSDDSPIIQTAP